MIVVGENLHQLMVQHKMVDRDNCFDETCIQLTLGETYIKLTPTPACDMLTYGGDIPKECVQSIAIGEDGLILEPHSAVLACSAEKINMPLGYMGLLQTKGSLARLYVSLHFSDGQIDSGFSGKVTFELFNASLFKIRIRKLQAVGNLYVFKTTTKSGHPYSGKYANADKPTIQLPSR